jgi:hypothetical protein
LSIGLIENEVGDFSMLSQRSKVYLTSAEVNSLPEWNLTPCLRVKVYTLPSGLMSHFSASPGLNEPS